MYGRRVSKSDPRVAACGAVDEFNAAVGVARVHCANGEISLIISEVQDDLILLMGEMATQGDDLERYAADGFERVSDDSVNRLSAHVVRIEKDLNIRFRDWATPGKDASPCSAFLDVARTICRRAEREAVTLSESEQLDNEAVLGYLNRLSDLLWLLARWEAMSHHQGEVGDTK